jgi:hypothetical protein
MHIPLVLTQKMVDRFSLWSVLLGLVLIASAIIIGA